MGNRYVHASSCSEVHRVNTGSFATNCCILSLGVRMAN